MTSLGGFLLYTVLVFAMVYMPPSKWPIYTVAQIYAVAAIQKGAESQEILCPPDTTLPVIKE